MDDVVFAETNNRYYTELNSFSTLPHGKAVVLALSIQHTKCFSLRRLKALINAWRH